MSNINQNKMEGCFLIARSIYNSNIWSKPDWYFKLWIYFIGKANHSDNEQFKRGELFLAGGYKELQLVLMKRGGYGKKTYEKYEISKAIMYMISDGLIATRKTTRGMYVIINNYNDYQSLQNYEKQQEKQMRSNSKATLVQLTSSTINNNDNNDNNVNNKYTKKFFQESKDQITLEAKKLYPNKNCSKAMDDFLEYVEIKAPKYANYKLAYFRWVREDKYNKYGTVVIDNHIESVEERYRRLNG